LSQHGGTISEMLKQDVLDYEPPERSSVRAYRIEQYEEMGFTKKESEQLADAKQADKFDLDYRKVKRAIEAGCGHKKAVYLFT
jgi:hypothetical protein